MADEESKQESKGFTVQDRRRFSPETGEAREEAPESIRDSAETQRKSGARRAARRSSETVARDQFFDFCDQFEHPSA